MLSAYSVSYSTHLYAVALYHGVYMHALRLLYLYNLVSA